MPTVTETPVRGYAHCRDARCAGYAQEEVDAIREEASYTFGENGGDGAFKSFVERSTMSYRFQNPEDAACASCGRDREVVGDPRPQYQALTGHDPMFLVGGAKFDPGMTIPPGEDRTAELEAQVARLSAMVEKLAGGEED